jgi:hypothetical protein
MQQFAKMKLAEQNGNADVLKDRALMERKIGGIFDVQPLKRRVVELGGVSAARFLVSYFLETESQHKEFVATLMAQVHMCVHVCVTECA